MDPKTAATQLTEHRPRGFRRWLRCRWLRFRIARDLRAVRRDLRRSNRHELERQLGEAARRAGLHRH